MKSPDKPKATAQEKALEQTSVAQWNDYVARYRPAEAELVRRAQTTAGERARVQGEVAGDVAESFKGLTRSTISSGGQVGADAASGRVKFALADDAEAQGRAQGLGRGVALTGARLDEDAQKLRIAGFGRQLATDATADLSRGARRATSLALNQAQDRFSRNATDLEVLGTIAGAASARGMEIYRDRKSAAQKSKFIEELGVDIENPFDFGSQTLGMNTIKRRTSSALDLYDG